jgi:hypothetical protein
MSDRAPVIYDLDRLRRINPNRKPSVRRRPPNTKDIARERKIEILLERDGPLCQCGCGKPIDPKHCEVEHRVPLWEVEHLPDEQRAIYFSIDNERLFRPRCQLRKNREEAARRAHFNRLAEKTQRHRDAMARKGTVE